MKLTISITKDILERSKMCGKVAGQYSRSINCAIALAIRDVFPSASVAPGWIRFNGGLKTMLPEKAQEFIVDFDFSSSEERVNMKPFSFDIDVPEEVISSINIDEVKAILQGHPNLRFAEFPHEEVLMCN